MASPEERIRAGILRGHDITRLPKPRPLIDDLLDMNSLAVLFGGSGGGKSLVTLDWGLHIASGLQWWGRPTLRGKVLYVVAEGASGTQARYEAWCEYHEVPEVPDIVWMTVPANVLLPHERGVLFDIAEEERPVLTVLDTLARHMPGGDENSFETMSQVVETLEGIKRVSGGCALGVHHTGKDEKAGSRGHSSLKGALDAELSLRSSRIDGTIHVSVYAEKFKDREDHRVLYSAHMEKIGASLVPALDDGIPLRPSERRALACLNGQWVSYSDWLSRANVAKSTFSRAQKRLLELKMVEHDPEHGWRIRT